MTDQQQPTVGRQVHYVSHGTPAREDGTQAYTSRCRAATVTEGTHLAHEGGADVVSLAVLNPTGLFFDQNVAYDAGSDHAGSADCPDAAMHGNPFRFCTCGWMEPTELCDGQHHAGGTWHWPARV